MARFPASWLDELRSRADIVQVISGYVPLKKNGRKHWGLCPFHGEKTASFSVDAERQLYYCFGCKASGNVINFIMEIERLDFQEAVKHLADQYHMALPQMEDDPDYQRRRSQRERLLAANKEAARFYHQMLFSPDGAEVLAYFRKRGLNDNVIRKFGLGASLKKRDALTQYLMTQGYTAQELQQAGLTRMYAAQPATETSPGRPAGMVDFFRNRAMFPIIDQYGNVLGFGGRSLDGAPPKYLNTGDTPIFNKRLGVYAANLLRKERHLDRVILVEGYMDVVALIQFGVVGVVATLGTALTQEQARLLKKFAPTVYLSYDGDSAGQHAILRGLGILEQEGIPARVLDFPDNLDPDEFIRRDGPEGFAKLPAISGEAYRMRMLRKEYDLSSQEGRIAYAKGCAEILKRLQPVELEVHLQELMVQTGFTRQVLLAQMAIHPQTPAAAAAPVQSLMQAPVPRPVSRPKPQDEHLRAQEMIITLLATGRLPGDIASEEDFDDPLLKRLFTALSAGQSAASLVEEEPLEQDRARITKLLMEPVFNGETDQVLKMAHQCLNRIRGDKIDARMKELQTGIGQMPPEEKQRALAEFRILSERKQKLRVTE